MIFLENEQTGSRITVAVLDTGIYPHRDFGSRIAVFKDFINGHSNAYDDNSHGTHVSGIIAGDGTASRGKYRGIAPGCNIAAVKVLDRNGEGSSKTVVEGIKWVIEHAEEYGIRIINLSFGTTPESTQGEDSVLVKAVEEAWDCGITVVSAAGNNGPGRGTVTVPGISRKIITVGSLDDRIYTDERGRKYANYSGRGPTKSCIVKPEIVTAGSGIVSCSNKRDGYTVKSGTSMAAPIVTAAIALLLQKKPYLTPAMVKIRLHDTAVPIRLPKEQQGWGMLDVKALLDS